MDRLADLVKQTFMGNERNLGDKILNTLEEQRAKLEGLSRERSASISRVRAPAVVPKTHLFDDFDVTEVARQLCLFEQSIYTCAIPFPERTLLTPA